MTTAFGARRQMPEGRNAPLRLLLTNATPINDGDPLGMRSDD